MTQVALVIAVGPSNEPDRKLLASCFNPITFRWHDSPIMVGNLDGQCVVLDGDADFVQHLNLREEKFMVLLKCHVPFLIEFVEFLFDIHDCIAEFPILLKRMDEGPDDHQQCYTILACGFKVMMGLQTILEGVGALSQNQTVQTRPEVGKHLQLLTIFLDVHLPDLKRHLVPLGRVFGCRWVCKG